MTPIHKRRKFFFALSLIFASFFAISVKGQILDSSKISSAEIKSFYSHILNEKRTLIIQTPSRMGPYDAYPVLYVLDGEAQTNMAGAQVQYLSEAYKIIPNLIVVGIANTDRTRDLTPTHSITGPDGKPDTSINAFGKNSGGGEKFLQFIREELMPYIESRYSTAPYKILSGHSLGGLMAMHCLVNHPDYFNAYIAISPSLQWDEKALLKQLREKPTNTIVSNRILFFSDANEDEAFHKNQLELDSVLRKKNITGLKYRRMFYPEETHISEPVKAFYDGIRFVYPNWHLPYNSSAFKKTMTSAMIKDHFAMLSKTYGYKVIPLHDEIIQISRYLRNDPKRIADAVDLLQMNAANYPSSVVVQETMGDTWLKAGDQKNAKTSYEKALLLDPANENIRKKIKDISQ